MAKGRVISGDMFEATTTAQALLADASGAADAIRNAAAVEAASVRQAAQSVYAAAVGALAVAKSLHGSHRGALGEVIGVAARAHVPGVAIGELVWIERPNQAPLPAEVVGFRGDDAMLLPLGDLRGVTPACNVWRTGNPLAIHAGEWMLGQVLNGLGQPLTCNVPDAAIAAAWAVHRAAPSPLERAPVAEPLRTGVRAIDGLLTLGRGQRIGLFAGSGVGKSTLLAQVARSAEADVIVLGLIGERGRELSAMLSGPMAARRAQTVAVCATSADPCMLRVRAASVATAIAEWFREQGKHVLLVVDSITRVARAQREVGLASGEPAGRAGYPPSTFALLPELVERAGTAARGSITALYSVLVTGDDLDEPIADEMRGLLDGHIVLDRRYAARGHFPPIDVPSSVSRLMPDLVSPDALDRAARVRKWIATYEEHRDLIALGAYKAGADPSLDEAVGKRPAIDVFLQQGAGTSSTWPEIEAGLRTLVP